MWDRATNLSDIDFASFITDAFSEVVDPYISMAADLAATWFELSAPESAYIATPAPLLPAERLTESALWALTAKGDLGLDRLTGTAQRAVFDGARETTLLNVERTNSRWARHASANACPFCRMLATRGAVYWTKGAAVKSHDLCHCVAIEDRDGNYQPPPYVEQWNQEYIDARRNAGSGDPKQILAAWRQL